MANLDPTFSPTPATWRAMPHANSSASARNCSASCSACSRSPAPTAREERIADLVFLISVYMDLAWWAAMAGDAAQFREWLGEVESAELNLAALRTEAVCA